MRYPVFFVALAYAAGLALFAGVDDSPRTLLLLSVAALLAGVVCLRREWKLLTLAGVLSGFLLLGGATIGLEEAVVPSNRIDRLVAQEKLDLTEAVRLRGWLRRDPGIRKGLPYFILELEDIETGGVTRATSGGVRVTFDPKNDAAYGDSLPRLRYGDRVEMLLLLRRPVTYRNPGSFDWIAYWNRQDLHLEGSLRSVLLLEQLPGRRGHRVLGWAQTLRTRLLKRLDRLIPPGNANAMLRAMLLGDRDNLPDALQEQFRRSGAYHVLVISGLHVGVIAFFLFWLLRRLGGNEWVTSLVTVAALVLYLLIVQDRPPVERAVWMVSLYLLARLFSRRVHLANPAALAALLILFAHPGWLFDASFHFSFGAVFLMAFFALPWIERHSQPYRRAVYALEQEERDDLIPEPRLAQFRLDLRTLAALLAPALFWSKNKEASACRLLSTVVTTALRAWEFFLVSFAIHLGFVLLIALYFQRVIWTGLLANVLVVPLVGLIVPLGLAALIIPVLGTYLAAVTMLLVNLLLTLVEHLASLPLSYSLPPPPLWLVLVYLAALGGLAVAIAAGKPRRQRLAAFALALPLTLVVTHPFPPGLPRDTLEVTVLDVGQGDSIFVAFPSGETWLLDGGGGPREMDDGTLLGHRIGRNVVAPYLRARGLKRLDKIWLSHAHADHMKGLEEILKEFGPASVHLSWPALLASRRPRLVKNSALRGIPVQYHRAGEVFMVGDVRVEILWPAAGYQPGTGASNNDSLVLRLCRLGHCLLLPGDIERRVERFLAQGSQVLTATALKVPHHGGQGTGDEKFLAAVKPKIAILSVGARNSHGHPRPDTLARLQVSAWRVYRTDRDGSVTLRITHAGFSARSFRENQPAIPYQNIWAKLMEWVRR